MDASKIDAVLAEAKEKLSSIEHERWAHWQSYMHSKCKRESDGSLTIPAELVTMWERQISTPYSELSEKEKQSDREQVEKYLPFIVNFLTDKL